MLRISFSLSKRITRPAIKLGNVLALIDTGAEIPVWTSDFTNFKLCFPDAVLKIESAPLRGFGEIVYCPVYTCTLKVGDLIYYDMPVMLYRMKNVAYQLILSASMFYELSYTIDNINKQLIIEVPAGQSLLRRLHIKDRQSNMHVLANEHIITPEEAIWRDYCARYNVQDEEAEMIRLQGIYKTRDNSEVLENIRHDYL